MRENVEEIQVTKKVVTYVADDGTVFQDAEECKKYENSARYAITSAFDSLPKSKCYGSDFLDEYAYMSCEGVMYGITINTANDLEIVNRYLAMYCATVYTTKPFQLGAEWIGKRVILELYEGDIYSYDTPEDFKKRLCDGVDNLFGEKAEAKEEN